MNTSTHPDYNPTQSNLMGSDRPSSPIYCTLVAMDKRVAELQAAIDQLGGKIADVLRPEPVQMTGVAPGSATKEPPAVESELTQRLRSHDRQLEQLICRLNNLRERVEV